MIYERFGYRCSSLSPCGTPRLVGNNEAMFGGSLVGFVAKLIDAWERFLSMLSILVWCADRAISSSTTAVDQSLFKLGRSGKWSPLQFKIQFIRLFGTNLFISLLYRVFFFAGVLRTCCKIWSQMNALMWSYGQIYHVERLTTRGHAPINSVCPVGCMMQALLSHCFTAPPGWTCTGFRCPLLQVLITHFHDGLLSIAMSCGL